jgi:two-component system CheB/CheR fusion protein
MENRRTVSSVERAILRFGLGSLSGSHPPKDCSRDGDGNADTIPVPPRPRSVLRGRTDPPAVSASPPESFLPDILARAQSLTLEKYERRSLLRRIRARMRTLNIDDFSEYRAYIETHPSEGRSLCDAVPVHRTEFFREGPVWGKLLSGLRDLLRVVARNEPIRVWSAGCASGEEAYSVAMILAELLGMNEFLRRVTIYATDISRGVLHTARQGVYSPQKLARIPNHLKQKYVTRVGVDAGLIEPQLRRSIRFARHDLLRDPPLRHMDLVLCRYTMIYFTYPGQQCALANIYLALNPRGIMNCSCIERPTLRTQLFAAENSHSTIYRPIPGQAASALALLLSHRKPWRMK